MILLNPPRIDPLELTQPKAGQPGPDADPSSLAMDSWRNGQQPPSRSPGEGLRILYRLWPDKLE